jgi:phage terminase large subunit-like protein
LTQNDNEREALLYLWSFWARPKQLAPPGDWSYWLLLAGRGFGKTRSITEWAREKASTMPGSRGAIVSTTAADARDIVVEGESGILAVCPPWNKPTYEPSKRRVTWPNGSMATLYTADEPDRLRGPQHHWAICDELAAWRFLEDAWSNLMFGLRLGEHPQCVVATTPRPLPLLRALLKDKATVTTRGGTYENRGNLAKSFFENIISRYEGTRLGRQELNAEILDDVPGALWTHATLDDNRVSAIPPLVRIVVAIDPAATSSEGSNETGIIVSGKGENGHGYLLEDLTLRASPAEWGKVAVKAYDRWGADRIVAETNQGGEMVEHVVKTAARDLFDRKERPTQQIAYRGVHASRGKHTRAEPIAALDEQGKIHHVGMFAQLEDQLATWLPGETSPDRLDARAWAFTDLLLGGGDSTLTSQNVSRDAIEQLFGEPARPSFLHDPRLMPNSPIANLLE